MRSASTIALLLATGCVRDNPRYLDEGASTGRSDDTADGSRTDGGAHGSGSDSEAPRGESTGGGSDEEGGESETSGGGIPMRCEGELVFEESFSGLPTGDEDWYVSAAQALGVSADDDALSVGFDHSSGYWVMGNFDPMPDRGSLGFEVLQAPDPAFPIQALVSLSDGPLLLQLSVALGTIDISWWDAQLQQATSATDTGPIPYDPVAHRWIRLSFDTEQQQATAAVSPDGLAWTTAFTADISPLVLEQSTVQFSVGAWGFVPGNDLVVIDNAFMCIE